METDCAQSTSYELWIYGYKLSLTSRPNPPKTRLKSAIAARKNLALSVENA